MRLLYLFILLNLFSCKYEKYEPAPNTTPLAECIDGHAKFTLNGKDYEFECDGYNLMGYVSLDEMNAEFGNDSWGWTDSQTGKEYALMGVDNGTAIVDISIPTAPLYLGKIPTATENSSWRDIKVYDDHVFIVSEAPGHGMQVFDLKQLRGLDSKQNFTADHVYTGFGQAHNIAINEESGYAYIAGSRGKGIYAFNISNPLSPTNELEAPNFGYSHDAQIVYYKGPDERYAGKEIYVGSNEDRVIIVDVTNKSNPILISEFKYDENVVDNDQYTHQAWLTQDHKYLLLGDEFDELQKGCKDSGYVNCDLVDNVKTYVIDFQDLENPKLDFVYKSDLEGIDHNGYVIDHKFFQASYTNGLRVVDIINIDQKSFVEIGFFDTHNNNHDNNLIKKNHHQSASDPDGHDGIKGEKIASMTGAWSVYPFFNSENIIISDIISGLFIVKRKAN